MEGRLKEIIVDPIMNLHISYVVLYSFSILSKGILMLKWNMLNVPTKIKNIYIIFYQL